MPRRDRAHQILRHAHGCVSPTRLFDRHLGQSHAPISRGRHAKTARTLKEDEHLLSIENKVASVSEIFRLQNAAELQDVEDRYLPKGAECTAAIVLAASRGKELGELTEQQPKTMVKIQGTPILPHNVDAYNAVGIKDIVVVRGYKKEAVNLPNLTYVDNNDFADTGELDSLLKALRSRKGPAQDTIISYGDVLFNKYIPQSLCQETDDLVIFVDSNWQEQSSYARLGGFAECAIPNSRTERVNEFWTLAVGI